jgi:hypothetical protein
MPPIQQKTTNAFAIIHFGHNPKYFELELYFCIMLAKNTSQNIVYMYAQDTPLSFVTAIEPYVYKTIGFNDEAVTYDASYKSAYASFNTLRTCDFVFAYSLTQYEKVCIVESDLVIMSNMDSIFELNTPAILYYDAKLKDLNQNLKYKTSKEKALLNCTTTSKMNGGVILMKPSKEMFITYVSSIPRIIETQCKYPNEALFEYVNSEFYNLPIKYNLSHYNTLKLNKYKMEPNGSEVVVFHFNETEYKHLDIVKENWLEKNKQDKEIMKKYAVKKIPIEFFENTIYNIYKTAVNQIVNHLSDYTKNAKKQFVKQQILNDAPPFNDIWIERYSQEKNCPYWYNPFTGDSTWTIPSGALRNPSKKVVKKGLKGGQLFGTRKSIYKKSRKNVTRRRG